MLKIKNGNQTQNRRETAAPTKQTKTNSKPGLDKETLGPPPPLAVGIQFLGCVRPAGIDTQAGRGPHISRKSYPTHRILRPAGIDTHAGLYPHIILEPDLILRTLRPVGSLPLELSIHSARYSSEWVSPRSILSIYRICPIYTIYPIG